MSASNKWREEGNNLFLKRNYKEAIEMYTKAIEKANTATHYTNRALCYFKLQQWSLTIEDCRRAIEVDPHSVKAYFFLGQSLCEHNLFDEGIVHLKRAHELSKESHENYGDEITRTIRNAKRRRWNFLEEKRIKQEIELQTYINRLMLEDKQRQISKIRENSALNNTNIKSNLNTPPPTNQDCSSNDLDSIVVNEQTPIIANNNNSNSAAADTSNTLNSVSHVTTDQGEQQQLTSKQTAQIVEKEKQQVEEIEESYQRRTDELNRLFIENDARRRKREIPDYLCGKISFELMHDPVITPSGITYDRYDIEQHLQRVGRFDPVTRQELTIDQLIPNLSMKEVIENFIMENDWLDGAL